MALGSSDAAPAPPASSAAAVAGLDPPLLWQHFLSLSALPRPSKREEAVVRWLRAFVEERKGRGGKSGLELREDAAGNVLIFRPGSGGGEDAEVVCVQGHIDMVTEKDAGVEHDFDRDPLLLRRSECGNWLTATGTTLVSFPLFLLPLSFLLLFFPFLSSFSLSLSLSISLSLSHTHTLFFTLASPLFLINNKTTGSRQRHRRRRRAGPPRQCPGRQAPSARSPVHGR
jgi:hypothetical protein